MSVHLLGGGWAEDERSWTGRFVDEARARAGGPPAIVVVLWARDAAEGVAYHEDYRDDFVKLATGEVRIVQLDPGRHLGAADLEGAHGLFIGGGLTPGYHAAVMPSADAIRDLVTGGLPYAGYSAGAMIAGDAALLGGWRVEGIPVLAENHGEGLDEVTLAPGLGLVDFVVDVHCAQAGTLSRAVAIVDAGLVPAVAAIDENTSLIVSGDGTEPAGQGRVWWVRRSGDGVAVTLTSPAQRST